jgi:polar amino acid transport system permease protein
LSTATKILPASWSRERRSAVTIAIAVTGLIAFLWLMTIPLAWMPEPIGSAAQQFAEGARVTMALTAVSGTIGIVLGVLAALAKLSKFPPLRWLSSFYIWAIRGTPLLVQVLFMFLALPALVPGLQLSDFNSAVVALAFNAGAYNAEAIRSGILAVNNFVSLLKDSSLAYVIGVVELSNIGNRIQSVTFQPIPVFITTASIYLILTTVMTQISGAIERQLDVERH